MPTRPTTPRGPRRRLAALRLAGAGALVLLLARPRSVDAWGEHGHRMIGAAATRALPADMPAFFRGAERRLSYLNPEPDRWRERAERALDPALDGATGPDHYVDLEFIPAERRAGVLAAPTRFAYVDSLRALQLDPPTVGLLPFRMLELTQRLRSGFRRWRATTDPEVRAWIEQRILEDAGVLGHYVADGSNPAHTSMHHNGWVGANPQGYATDRRFHGRFESAFVTAQVSAPAVQQELAKAAPPRAFDDVRTAVRTYLDATHAQLEPLYALDKRVPFDSANTSAEHRAFAVQRLAAGATMLRDLWWTAWITSADTSTAPRSPR